MEILRAMASETGTTVALVASVLLGGCIHADGPLRGTPAVQGEAPHPGVVPAPAPGTETSKEVVPPQVDDAAFLQLMSRSVVAVEALDGASEPAGGGAAFFVGTGCLATCWHVIEGASSARIRFATGQSFPVLGVLWLDREADLVVIACETPGLSPLPLQLEPSPPAPGARLIVVGPPIPGDPSCIASYGRVLPNPDGETHFADGLHFRMPIAPGWSGSPVLCSQGTVVGIAQAGLDATYSRAVPAKHASMAMESAENWTLQLLREVSSRGAYGRSQTEPPGRGGRSVHLLPVAAAWARGDRDEAEKLLRAVLDKSPSDGEGWQYLAFMMHEQGKSKLAIEALRRACEAQPASSKAHYLLGTELLDAGSDEEAVRELREAVRLDDKSSDAHYGLGYALSRTARYVDAVAEYKRVLEIDPSYVAARTGLEYAEGMLRAGH